MLPGKTVRGRKQFPAKRERFHIPLAKYPLIAFGKWGPHNDADRESPGNVKQSNIMYFLRPCIVTGTFLLYNRGTAYGYDFP